MSDVGRKTARTPAVIMMENFPMTEEIGIELSILDAILEVFRSEGAAEVTTLDILRRYQGGYFNNSNIAVNQSFNAKFGRALKRQEERLRIREVASRQPTTDDLKRKTTSSVWAIQP
jgi:hypothetical protein